jgi:mitogen-activated protein kinase 1/3
MEVQLLMKLDHPCVVKLFDIIPPQEPLSFTEFYIILDYVESDMRRILKNNIRLDMVHIKTIMYNVLLGIKYLHQQ